MIQSQLDPCCELCALSTPTSVLCIAMTNIIAENYVTLFDSDMYLKI
jgi:hypothetical protein